MALMSVKKETVMLHDLELYERARPSLIGLGGHLIERHGQRHTAELLITLEGELDVPLVRVFDGLRPLVLLRALDRVQAYNVVVSVDFQDYLRDRLIQEVRTDPLRGVYSLLQHHWGEAFSFLLSGVNHARG